MLEAGLGLGPPIQALKSQRQDRKLKSIPIHEISLPFTQSFHWAFSVPFHCFIDNCSRRGRILIFV